MKLYLVLFSLFFAASSLSFESGGIPFYENPKINQCWPKSPYSKKYISVKKKLFKKTYVFTCLYSCLDRDGLEHEIVGTRTVKVRFIDSGKKVVCKGYEKDMIWVETPRDPKYWGHWEVGQVRPFQARGSKIAEIEQWALDYTSSSKSMLMQYNDGTEGLDNE
ncbi:hypothetical protein HBN50_11810 [Halobacteriovorax sp. GB3]|uniref:hypothetical protein n=1 Tax=Halobacteriovorax sp. GB3 TaxID=2719615 RepID=UPI0023617CB3|nr:hypothetical protein [Halobacteriovorax sp. GB3]MDD0853787.1 hypothetical protein [Halobacteriovorax sp. GB3]